MQKCLFILCGIIFFILHCGNEQLKETVLETHGDGSKKKVVYFYSRPSDPRRIMIYNQSGQLMSDQTMKNGKPDSITTIFHKNGSKYKEVFYIQDEELKKELKHGKEMSWYDNSQIKSEINFDRGKPVGIASTFYKNGAKQSETLYKDGKKTGIQKDWYENGNPMKEVACINGDIHGIVKEYYDNGNLKRVQTYTKNVLNGLYTTYHKNGKKETECTYENGKIEGKKKEWYATGRLAARATYKNGKLVKGRRF